MIRGTDFSGGTKGCVKRYPTAVSHDFSITDSSSDARTYSNNTNINSTQYTTMKQSNLEQQVKVVVFLTKTKNNKIISSKFLSEGWVRIPHANADLNLLAVKQFDLPISDLDKIVVKEIFSINVNG